MFHKLRVNIHTLNKQKGSALVLTLFIMVVMTLLGTALVRMSSSNAETIAYEVIGTRAYQAAQAGAQRKLSEVFPLLPNAGVCTVESEYDFSSIEGLSNCKAKVVNCSDAGLIVDGITYYTITSTGQCSVAEIFTSRTIEIQARSL
ncbi:MAG: MSHA biogenesis protein MshP [Colwellia sp.]|jgi:MSHA biogenesis protein MshP